MKKLYLDTKEKIYRATSIIFIVQLFGALGAGYFVKHWKLSFAPILFMLAILIPFDDIGASTLLTPAIIAFVVYAFIMYKIRFLDKKEKKAKKAK